MNESPQITSAFRNSLPHYFLFVWLHADNLRITFNIPTPLSASFSFSWMVFCVYFFIITFSFHFISFSPSPASSLEFFTHYLIFIKCCHCFGVQCCCICLLKIAFRRWWCRLHDDRHRCWRDGNLETEWRCQLQIVIMRDHRLALEVWMMSYHKHRTQLNLSYLRTRKMKWSTTWMNRIRQVSHVKCRYIFFLKEFFNHLKNPSSLFERFTCHSLGFLYSLSWAYFIQIRFLMWNRLVLL